MDFYHLQGAKDIIGIDITDISINHLKQKYPKYYFIKEDVSSPSLASWINREFDILNVFDVLYHITDDQAFRRAIANICCLTKDSGYIFISDLFGSRSINVAEHVKMRDRGIYKATLEENGVKVVAMYPLYYLLNRPVFGKTKIMRLEKTGASLDNLFAPIYYYLDGIFLSPERSNLNLIVAKKVKL